MKVYVLVLTTGQYEDKKTTLIRGYVDKGKAEEERLRELVRLEEVVRKHAECGKLCDDFLNENPPPGPGVCTCGPKNEGRCTACEGWDTVYSVVKTTICRDINYNPEDFPMWADDGFRITVEELDVHGF